MRTLGWILSMLAACAVCAVDTSAQFDDEILFPIEYSIIPEVIPAEGTAIVLPRTIDSTRIFIDLRNTGNTPYEGTLSLQIGVKAGPWTLSQPIVQAEGFTCSGDNKQKTCTKPLFILREGETLRIIQPIICPTFSTELTRIELSGPEVPTGEFTIKQHSNPFAVVAGHTEPQYSSPFTEFIERIALRQVDPPAFTSRVNTLTGLSGGTETLIGPPGGTLFAGTTPCPPASSLVCPTVPFTFVLGQTYTAEFPMRTRVGTITPNVLFSASFPDNTAVSGFNVTHPVKVRLEGPDPESIFSRSPSFEDVAGGYLLLTPAVRNSGTVNTTGAVTADVVLSAGLSCKRGRSFRITFPGPIAPGATAKAEPTYVYFQDGGAESIRVTISGGGDVRDSNNIQIFNLDVFATRDDTLERDAEELARILTGR